MTINRPQRFRDSRGGNYQHPPQPKLPDGYLKEGYFDDKGNPLPQVLQKWPIDIADALFKARPRMTTNQLRGAFFAEVRRLERKLGATCDFDMVRPELLKLNAYVVDRRKKYKVSALFEEFITVNLREAARGEQEFINGFVPHFECLVGFYPETRG